jgi:hypothetical protein
MDIFSIAAGAAGVGVVYFLYLAGTKGLPAALAWAKAKWNAGKADFAALQGDVQGLSGKVTALETGAIAELKGTVAAVQADVAKLKAAAPPAFLGASQAPALAPANG